MYNKEYKSIFQQIYDSEINFEISNFYDDGFTIKVGDNLNGFDDRSYASEWKDVESALVKLVKKCYPKSRVVAIWNGTLDSWKPTDVANDYKEDK